ncbi:MAG: hypothetical protein HY556_01665 [Euryarchaeota archaeon]|nr:hypothetical protein [Euryarchaeota archaeon]
MAPGQQLVEKTTAGAPPSETAVPAALPLRPVDPALKEAQDKVMGHLLFHKAMISEDGGNEKINQYIELVRESKDGAHVSITNPVDKAIAIAFELVMEEHLNPWHIDLVQFSTMYLKRVHEEGSLDLITAGRIVHMAWTVLKLQSDEAVTKAETVQQQAEEAPSWEEIDTAGWSADDVDYAFTTTVVGGRQAPIDEKVRHKGDRKVTLYELVEAFEEARGEAELRQILTERREAERMKWKFDSRADVNHKVHKEDLEAEKAEVWARITRLNGAPIPITDIRGKNREDHIKTLISVLFLVSDNKLKIWQEDFPYGMIYVQNLLVEKHDAEAARN